MKLRELNKTEIKNLLIKPPFFKRFVLMLLGVIVMGICVSVLKLCHFGTDPFAATNYGLSETLGLDFGTTQMLFNAAFMLLVICCDISRLGLGTIGNMILVGYSANLTTYITEHCFGITSISNTYIRIIVMLISLLVFIVAVAIYVNAGLGSSAYDAFPYVLHEWVKKITKKEIPFKYVRILFDGIFTLIAYLLHGEVGILTILMVFTLGPMIDFVSNLLSGFLGNPKA